jgi:hypothetical protein
VTYEIIPIAGALFSLELLRQLYTSARALRSSRPSSAATARDH